MISLSNEVSQSSSSVSTIKRKGPYRVLVTDADYKQSIALAKYIKQDLPGVHITGHKASKIHLASYYSYFDRIISGEPLVTTLARDEYDQVIPVAGKSTLIVAENCPDKAVVSTLEQLRFSYDKRLTMSLAQTLGMPVPRTQAITTLDDLKMDDVSFPCVVKADHEVVSAKGVRYCSTSSELISVVEQMLARLKADNAGVLIQEMIRGTGHGFFALMQEGKPLRVFMHRRLRENPPTGGVSTAATGYDSPRLKELGLRFLSAVGWHGVAMVEFKYDTARNDFYLMEVNGKLWGSLELALCSGVNFGADIIRMFRNDPLEPRDDFDPIIQFFWPLDGDLKTLCRTHSLVKGVRGYFSRNSHTNCGQSLVADLMKSGRMLRDAIYGRE